MVSLLLKFSNRVRYLVESVGDLVVEVGFKFAVAEVDRCDGFFENFIVDFPEVGVFH